MAEKISKVFTYLFIVFISIAVIRDSFVHTLFLDAAALSTAAKSVAFGKGYIMENGKNIQFDPHISTGPTLILPAALAIKLFGNKHWVTNLSTGIINSILFIVFLYLLKGVGNKVWAIRLIFILFIIFFTQVKINGNSVIQGNWHYLMGDATTGFLILLSAIIMFVYPQFIHVAGVLAGMAVVTKTLGLVYLIPLMAFWIYIQKSQHSLHALFRNARTYILSYLVFPTVFELTKLYILGQENYLKVIRIGIAQITQSRLSGFDTLRNIHGISDISLIIKSNINMLFWIFGGPYVTLAFFILIGILLIFSRGKTKIRHFYLGLLTASCIHLVWWISFSVGWPRYLLIFFLGTFTAISVMISNISNSKIGAVALILFLTVLYPHSKRLYPYIFNPWRPNNNVQALYRTAEYMKSNANNHIYTGASWLISYNLEYILPTIHNFTDYSSINVQTAQKPVVLVRDEYWDALKSSVQDSVDITQIETSCNTILYEDSPYTLSLCRGSIKGDSSHY